jgi:hypothetical protein
MVEYELEPEGGGESVTVIGKVRARGTDRATDAVLRALRSAGLSEDAFDGVCVPEPLGVIPEFRMTLQRKVPGVCVAPLLPVGWGAELARRVAEAAHRVHTAGVPSDRSHALGDELRILRERLSTLGTERPEWAARLDRLLEACTRLAGRVTPTEPCGIHRDYYADQLLTDGPRLYVLDFDLYARGDPSLDIGNFIGHLTEQSLRSVGRPDGLADREAWVEERFLQLAGAKRRMSVRAYAMLTLARHISISTKFPDRRAFTERLLDLCEERLGRDGVLPGLRDTVAVQAASVEERFHGGQT